jgi:multidrug efflux pump subunit AcrB
MRNLNLSRIAVSQPSVTLFLLIAFAAAGLFAFFSLGRAEDPSFTVKTMTISVAWPGATAREMQDQVANQLEKRLQELDWYDRVDTTSRPGLVSMQLQLKDTTPPGVVQNEYYQARKKLTDEAANLPRGIIGPFFNDEYSDVYFGLFALQAEGMAHRGLVGEAETIRARLLQVPGVKKVNIIGEQRQRVFVEISHQRLATLGVTADQIIAALSSQISLTPAGQVETGSASVMVRVDGGFGDLDAVRATPITASGRVLRIADIATVSRGYEEPSTYRVRHDGAPALMLGVVMDDRWNGTALGTALERETQALREAMPLGLTLTTVADQSRNIAYAYGEFMLKFAAALAVVLLVILLALGFRVGLVVAAAVPLTLAVVFVIMLATDRAFDRITLGALILSLGLLVDDAIIAIEMMVVKMQEGLDRVAAATFAWGATAAPMLAGTLVTIIGFLPVGFAQSTAGEYAGNIFWIVGFSLIVSWFVAVYFTPYLGVLLLPKIAPVAGGHAAIYATPRYERLRRAVGWCVHRRRVVAIGTAVALLIAGAVLALLVPKQFFPTSDRAEVLVEINLPKGSSMDATTATAARIETAVRARPEVVSVNTFIGAGAPRFFLSLNPELPDPSFAKIVILTSGPAERDTLRAHIEALIGAGRYPEARVRVTQLIFGPPVPFPVTFRVSGPDPQRLRMIADQVSQVVAANPDTRAVHRDWEERTPTVALRFDHDRLRLLGLTPVEAGRQIQALVSGVTVAQIRTGDRRVDVVVRAPDAERRSLESLGDLTLTTTDGRAVPVAGIARLDPTFEDPILRRRDRSPTITVLADIRPGVQPPDVTAAILPELDEMKAGLPPSYSIAAGGTAEESGKATAALLPVFPVMIALMLLVTMLQVRSFRVTGLVFLTAPLGLIGAVPALLVTGTPFGFNAILGLIGLAGILMRNTLILVDQIEIERVGGLEPHTAVIEATVRRTRPVLLTALAAVLAFLPLTLSTFWGALAIVLIGGTIVGTALTLFFLPAAYALFFNAKRPAGAADGDRQTPRGLQPLLSP